MTPDEPSDTPHDTGIGRARVDGGRIGRQLVTKRNVLRLLFLLLLLVPVVDYLTSL
ncbi:hypothetical protein [Halorubrum sp. 48-1-W]|uniref:hypothetical protein n=1 Tax=Halorubrum sp. 48-1-W TaxID=2249761 RepID=UPI00130088E6|nr:hypothetical protein [Halorubrum sp. 48-1-W]